MENNNFKKIAVLTIISFFTFLLGINNVSAVTVAGSLADSNDNDISDNGTRTQYGSLSGTTCQAFNVSQIQNYRLKDGYNFIGDQNAIMYGVSGAGLGCASSYTAFCIDPGRGAGSGSYYAESIDLNSTFGKEMYALYQLSKGYNLSDPTNYFAFEIAARGIATKSGQSYNGKHTWYSNPGEFSSHGTSGALASTLYNQAVNSANNYGSIASSMLGLKINKVGGFTASETGNSFSVKVNVVVQNCTSQNCVSINDITPNGFEWDPVSDTNPTYNANAKTLTFTGTINGLTSSNCNRTVSASLKNNNEARNALRIRPKSQPANSNSGYQSYIVFAGGNSDITAKAVINGCPNRSSKKCRIENGIYYDKNGNQVTKEVYDSVCGSPNDDDDDDDFDDDDDDDSDSCGEFDSLVCTDNDVSFNVINEGNQVKDGKTEWEACVFNKSDAAGNTYNVTSTSSYRNDNNSFFSDTVYGYLTNGEELHDADYCVISCKEKYAFLLPGNKKNVKQGTYFSFDVDGKWSSTGTHAVVGISAERLCASTPIEKDKFNTRALDLRKQQIDYLNMYLYYRQLFNAMWSAQAMEDYRSHTTSATIEMDPDQPTDKEKDLWSKWYDNGIEWTKYENKYWDEYDGKEGFGSWFLNKFFKNGRSINRWDGSNVSVNIKYYKLSNENDLNSALVEQTKTIRLNQSFKDAFPEISRYDFYSRKYSDYAVFNTKIVVDEWNDSYQGDKSKYHYYGYNEETRQRVADTIEHRNEECPDNPGSGWYCDWDEDVYEDYQEKVDKVDKDYQAKINNYIEGSEDWDWNGNITANSITEKMFTKYRDVLDNKIKDVSKKAKEKYDALTTQIKLQGASISECTNYVSNAAQNTSPYNFDPVISFSYQEQAYMNMLAPNELENMHDGDVNVNYSTYYCTGDPGAAENIFTSCGDGAGSYTEFKYGDDFTVSDNDGFNSNINDVKDKMVEQKTRDIKYYNVSRIGSRATYGRYSANGDACSGSSYINGKGSEDSYCYEFYQSAKQFYVRKSDGTITTTPSNDSLNSTTILGGTDGRVYPVSIKTEKNNYPYYITFSNIGQYNDTSSLGRIMGGGDAEPVMSGLYEDTEVCYYNVCTVNDPECNDDDDDDDNSTCDDVLMNECNNGNITKSNWQLIGGEDYFNNCIKKLMDASKSKDDNCCKKVDSVFEISGHNTIKDPDAFNKYQEWCSPINACTGFNIQTDSAIVTSYTNMTDIATVNNNGALQFNARTISLNNVFPNGDKGINWKTNLASDVLTEIQSVGDGIFAGESQYHFTISPNCATQIKAYNNSMNNESDGGFSDTNYTVDNYNNEVRTSLNKVKEGATHVVMDENFKTLVSDYCNFEGTYDPTKNIDKDESRVTT